VLVLAGDISSDTNALWMFAGWPAPVIYVAGNHEFYGRNWHHVKAAHPLFFGWLKSSTSRCLRTRPLGVSTTRKPRHRTSLDDGIAVVLRPKFSLFIGRVMFSNPDNA
jgi:hypothetical protein